ncbi:MAG: histidine phosphatase family protein [Sutterellaceae bacterium]|nr:histidine phosphatase family protein [Burkholderiaceae bacterium]MDW8430876.1 histidine phosphatase family protein [Sutterellaceae bacterium]
MHERRRLLLMRHGAVEYFEESGRILHPDHVPLTAAGIAQARAAGQVLAQAQVRVDRVICSGLLRTRMTAQYAMAAAKIDVPLEEWPQLQEIRGGRLAAIPEPQLREAFLSAFRGAVPLQTRFLGGETIGELFARTIPALQQLLDDPNWDTALLVLHGGVNRALISWLLTGQQLFLGGLEQAPGCLNVIDVGGRHNILRVLNYCPLDVLQAATRASTMELLYARYQSVRTRARTPE